MKKKLLGMILLLSIVLLPHAKVFAATDIGTTDGLEISVTTDQDSYQSDDTAKVTYKVTNTNTFDISNVKLESEIPEELKQSIGDTFNVEKTIKAGESIEGTVNVSKTAAGNTKNENQDQLDQTQLNQTQPNQTQPAVQEMAEAQLQSNAQVQQDQDNNSAETGIAPFLGDHANIIIFAVLLLISAFIIVMIVRHKKGKKYLSLLLIVTMFAGISMKSDLYNAAEKKQCSYEFTKKLLLGEDEYSLKLKISYPYMDQMNRLYIDTTDFQYNSENNTYTLSKKLNALKGTLKNAADYSTLSVDVYNDKNSLIYQTQVPASADLAFDSIGLFPGVNTITVTANGENKQIKKINLYDSVGAGYANIPGSDTDTDGDGLFDLLEDYYGTDKTKADTDGDGITDYQEVSELGTDPLKTDTDGNGVSDFDEDADSDGISNGEEYLLGTSPVYNDSDYDGLLDGEEVNTYHTDPAKKDTDEDGADDYWEISNGYDPLVYNSSFIINKKLGAISETNPVVPSVTINGVGVNAENLEINDVSSAENELLTPSIAGYLGSAFDFSLGSEEANSSVDATITFEYDESMGTVGADFQPKIYYYNESTHFLECLENQTIENGRVTAHVAHFSTYILLNSVEFDKVWENEIKVPEDQTNEKSGLDVVLAIDSSDSMTWNDGSNLRLKAAEQFVSKLGTTDRGAIVDFNHNAKVTQTFTSDQKLLKDAIYKNYANGGTNLSKGLDTAISLFTSADYKSDNDYKYIIFLTDGQGSYSDQYAQNAKDNNIVIYSIGLSRGSSEQVLKSMAETTGGKYFYASEADHLGDVYDDISKETIDYTTDTNKDGISDYYTKLIMEGKLVTSTGSTEYKNCDLNHDLSGNITDDCDGDGLKNGEELVIKKSNGKVYLDKVSDPYLKDSDGDGLDDKAEKDHLTNALNKDTDGDGVNDKTEINNGSNPLVIDCYESDAVNYLKTDSNYYYEDVVSDYDDGLGGQIGTALGATIFGVWDVKELYRDILTGYFEDYTGKDDIEQVQVDDYKTSVVENVNATIGKIDKLTPQDLEDITKDGLNIYGLKGGIKGVIDAIHGCKSVSEINLIIEQEYFFYLRQLQVYSSDFGLLSVTECGFSSRTTILLEKYTTYESLSTNKLAVADKLWIGLSVLDAGVDVVNTWNDIEKVNANNKVFERKLDILTDLRDNGKREYVKKAADQIIRGMSEKYGNVIAESVAVDIAEGAANVLLIIASKNPYVAAVMFVRNTSDWLLGISADIRQKYEILCFDCLTASVKKFVRNSLSSKGTYYSAGNVDEANSYLNDLIQVRICGEMKFIEYKNDDGFIGSIFGDNSEAISKISNSTNEIMENASLLKVGISASLKRDLQLKLLGE